MQHLVGLQPLEATGIHKSAKHRVLLMTELLFRIIVLIQESQRMIEEEEILGIYNPKERFHETTRPSIEIQVVKNPKRKLLKEARVHQKVQELQNQRAVNLVHIAKHDLNKRSVVSSNREAANLLCIRAQQNDLPL